MEEAIGRMSPKPPEQMPEESAQTAGHRRSMDWMGNEIETLEDLLRPALIALCIGINPAPTSVSIGHYYQGQLGQQFFGRLQKAGVSSFTSQGWQDDEAFDQGIGFTDIVKRPTSRADDVTEREFSYGKALLLDKISNYKPRMLIFSFKKSAQALFGPIEGNGFIEGAGIEGVPVFVMPGPYAKRDEVTNKLEELSRLTT
jgi:double-stranded uracil-DNA glycosylase